MTQRITDGLVAGAIAGVVSGAPSTLHAFATGRDPLAATVAAGSIALPDEDDRATLVAAAVPVHMGLSLAWGVVLATILPRRATATWGALAGAAIAAVDLGAARACFPRVSALPQAAQVADHVCYGAVAGWFLARRRARYRRGAGTS